MLLVTAIIKPDRLAKLQDSLPQPGIVGMTVTEVKGFGRQQGRVACGGYVEEVFDYLPKVKVEIAIEDNYLESCLDAISTAAHTGRIGDGKVFVVKLDDAVRVRTGETGSRAITATVPKRQDSRRLLPAAVHHA